MLSRNFSYILVLEVLWLYIDLTVEYKEPTNVDIFAITKSISRVWNIPIISQKLKLEPIWYYCT